NPAAFKDYIAYTTNNRHSVVYPIEIELVKPLDQFKAEEEISSKYVSISPQTEGQLNIKNGSTLVVSPKHHLQPDTEYTVKVKSGDLYSNTPEMYRTYTFGFKT